MNINKFKQLINFLIVIASEAKQSKFFLDCFVGLSALLSMTKCSNKDFDHLTAQVNKENINKILFNGQFLILTITAITSLFLVKYSNLANNIDPLIKFSLFSLGLLVVFAIYKKSLTNPAIPYLGIQMITFAVFFEKKYLALLGLNLKLYGLIFVIAAMAAAYYLLNNFKYLWNNFLYFRLLFLFFIMNLIYILLHYYSDFRLSTYMLSRQYTKAALAIGSAKTTQNMREFGDLAQYVIWIESFIPIICSTISLMIFAGLKNIEDINDKIFKLIKYFIYVFFTYYNLAILAFFLRLNGTNTISLSGDVDPGSNFYLPIFLFLLATFKYFLNIYKENNSLLKLLLNITLIYNIIFIFLSGSSATYIALLTGSIILIAGNNFSGFNFPFFEKLFEKARLINFKKYINYLAILLIFIAAYTALKGFSSNDAHSTAMRLEHWRSSYSLWAEGLSLKTLIFGYGIDSLRELLYYASLSSAVERGIQSPHNYYILMFYEQGFISFLFWGAIISTVISSLKIIKNIKSAQNLKLFATLSLAITVSLMTLLIFLDITLFIKMIFFSITGLLESIKYAYLKSLPETYQANQ